MPLGGAEQPAVPETDAPVVRDVDGPARVADRKSVV